MTRQRDRSSGLGLLPRMEARPRKDGKTTYRYHPLGGKPVNLGTDREAAVRQVLDLNGRAPGQGSLRWVWEKFKASKRWADYAEGTRADYELAWKQIDARLGHMPIAFGRVALHLRDEHHAHRNGLSGQGARRDAGEPGA